MSWRCAFQARPPVAFRAVQFQLNFQPYVLSRLSPSLAIFCKNRQGSCSLQNLQFFVLHSRKLSSCSMFKLLHHFYLLVVLRYEIVLFFIAGKLQGIISDQRKNLVYAILCWLILEETQIVQWGLKVPAYPLYFHLIGCIFQEWFPIRLGAVISVTV